MSRLHVESMYGFYHGQDPRCFDPDEESCTPEEIAAHKAAVAKANAEGWHGDETHSGCHMAEMDGNVIAIVTTSHYGIGTYEIVMTDDGEFVRDATYEDLQRECEWEETAQVKGGE